MSRGRELGYQSVNVGKKWRDSPRGMRCESPEILSLPIKPLGYFGPEVFFHKLLDFQITVAARYGVSVVQHDSATE